MHVSASFWCAALSWLPASKEVKARSANAAGDGASEGETVVPFPCVLEAVNDAAAIAVAC